MKISKKMGIYVIAIIIVIAASPLIYWVVQNQLNTAQNKGPTYYGNYEITQQNIRFWTDIQPDHWSGMETNQKWSFASSLSLSAQVQVTSLGSPSFYAEVIMVSQSSDVDEGFGFQIFQNSTDSVRIKGWSWNEETESFTDYIVKPINVVINLEAKKTSAGQIDFYVDSSLIGSITSPIPVTEGVMNFDLWNGAQGGYAEVLLNYQVTQ